MKLFTLLLAIAMGWLPLAPAIAQKTPGTVAPKPLYRDPVFDGAADPVVIWNPSVKRWWMFYTNRRAKGEGFQGVTWVHGTRIGIAESADGGATWKYLREAAINDGTGLADATHWAPDVVSDGKTFHMFLTVVPGIFSDWQHPRSIVHLTSTDLINWNQPQTLQLASDRVIDASAFRLADGTWRLWYNNERDRKSIYFADSPDLKTWTDKGKAVGDQGGEGPKVFRWHGAYWMITDVWRGLAVYRSDDLTTWKRQAGGNLLEAPGLGTDDQVKGGHADVVVSGERAFLFYFTHPGRRGADEKKDGYEQRRSSIQVVELEYKEGVLSCDRDKPTYVQLRR
jgi:beta-xylosidase